MKRIISVLAMITAASIGVAGCGGDDDDTTTTTGGGGKGNAAGQPATGNAGEPAANNGGQPAASGGAPAANGGAPDTSGNVMCDASQNGVCQNPMDCPFVVDGTARMTAGTCGQGCVASSDKNCSRDCILKKLDMSSSCAKCYADTVNCTIQNCLAECIADPEAAACKQCQVDQGCRAAFNDCSGLPG